MSTPFLDDKYQYVANGGPGSGRKGHKELARELVDHITSENLGHAPHNWLTHYSELEDHEKKSLTKDLHSRGLLHPIDAHKKNPIAGIDVLSSAKGQYNLHKENHEAVPTNRHEPFKDSETFKKMVANSLVTNELVINELERTKSVQATQEDVAANLSGNARYAKLNGRDYIVAPLTMIVPGVLNGSKGRLHYSSEEIGKDPSVWNGVPITVYHPSREGRNVSARDPDVLQRQGIGQVFKTVHNGKLQAEGWFDVEATKRVDNRVLQALEAGNKIELSTGLFTDNEPAPPGSNHNGKAYDYIAKNYRPDHLAILPDKKGACSLADGCGVFNQLTVNDDGSPGELVENGGPGSGRHNVHTPEGATKQFFVGLERNKQILQKSKSRLAWEATKKASTTGSERDHSNARMLHQEASLPFMGQHPRKFDRHQDQADRHEDAMASIHKAKSGVLAKNDASCSCHNENEQVDNDWARYNARHGSTPQAASGSAGALTKQAVSLTGGSSHNEKQALVRSRNALRANKHGEHLKASNAHRRAADAHLGVAKEQDSQGNSRKALAHKVAADTHVEAANRHLENHYATSRQPIKQEGAKASFKINQGDSRLLGSTMNEQEWNELGKSLGVVNALDEQPADKRPSEEDQYSTKQPKSGKATIPSPPPSNVGSKKVDVADPYGDEDEEAEDHPQEDSVKQVKVRNELEANGGPGSGRKAGKNMTIGKAYHIRAMEASKGILIHDTNEGEKGKSGKSHWSHFGNASRNYPTKRVYLGIPTNNEDTTENEGLVDNGGPGSGRRGGGKVGSNKTGSDLAEAHTKIASAASAKANKSNSASDHAEPEFHLTENELPEDMSFSDAEEEIREAFLDKFPVIYDYNGMGKASARLVDCYDGYVIYKDEDDDLHKLDYSWVHDEVDFDTESVEVEQKYVASEPEGNESLDLEEEMELNDDTADMGYSTKKGLQVDPGADISIATDWTGWNRANGHGTDMAGTTGNPLKVGSVVRVNAPGNDLLHGATGKITEFKGNGSGPNGVKASLTTVGGHSIIGDVANYDLWTRSPLYKGDESKTGVIGTSLNEETEMKLTANERETVIEGLLTNNCGGMHCKGCGTTKNERFKDSDKEALMKLPDSILNQLVEGLKHEHIIVNEEETKKAEGYVLNSQTSKWEKPRMKTEEEYVRELPPSMQRLVRNAQRYEVEQKTSLIETITSNSRNPFTKEQLEKMDVEQLSPLAQLAAPVEMRPAPNYFGASVPTGNEKKIVANEKDDNDFLALPTLNFKNPIVNGKYVEQQTA